MQNNSLIKGMVSVIIPIYNSENYLQKCVESVIKQSYAKIEILLINDGSTDNSGKLCDAYAFQDRRILVIHKKNGGPSDARNIGIENSKGELIFFIDADDFIENNAIELLMEKYSQHGADVIIGNFNNIKNNHSTKNQNGIFPTDKLLVKSDIINYVRNYLTKPNKYSLFVYSWGRLFKSSVIKNNNIAFDINLRTYEDVAFNFEYWNYTNEIMFLKEALYHHLLHENQASASMNMFGDPKNLFGYKQALINLSNYLKNCNQDINIRKEVGHAYICYTIIQLVRTCGQINNSNKKKIYTLVHEITNDADVADNLQFYSPSKGDSKIIPVLMKLKLAWPIIWVCKYKSRKRYARK